MSRLSSLARFSGATALIIFGAPSSRLQLPQFTVDSSSLEISAEEYWEYDPGDGGGPIWDKDSGEQIGDRWTVQQWA